MDRQDAKDEFSLIAHQVRPFAEEQLGMRTDARLRDALEAFEHLVDFEEHLRLNDPAMLDSCAESIGEAKQLLGRHLAARGGRRYLEAEDRRRI